MEARCLAERDFHRYGIPRTDLKVTLDGVEIKPALALGGWVALEPSPDGTMVMDDLVLTETGQVTLTSKRRVFHSLEVTSPVPSSFSRRRGADAPGTICQQLMKPTAPGTICQRHGDQPLMGSRACWRHLPRCRALDCGTRPLRRAFLTSQPKWQGDLPELARPGTLFLGKRPQARDIGPCSGLIPS